MDHFRTILIIGVIEICIGAGTLIGTFNSLILGINQKPPGVLAFVLIAATFSTLLGIGILRFKRIAYSLLLYFSSLVLISKVLIFLHVFELNGALTTGIPEPLKNIASMAYHAYVIYCLKDYRVKKIFHH